MNFQELAFALQVVVAFGGGVIAFLSPCVLPLVPGYMALMSGYSIDDIQEGRASRKRMLKVTLLFVLGFTLVFVATGAGATQVAKLLNSNQTLLDRVAGGLVIAFALLMFGMAFTNRGIFGFVARERRLEVRPSRLGPWAPPVMGVAFGFGWTACIGPILAGVLALGAVQETVGRGMLLLFVFSLGLGVPFVATGLLLQRAFRAFGSIRRWMRPINITSAVVMAVFGVLLFTGNVGRLAGFFVDVFTGIPILEELASI